MIHQQDYTAYQTYALLDFNISFEKDVPADDISRAVIEVMVLRQEKVPVKLKFLY